MLKNRFDSVEEGFVSNWESTNEQSNWTRVDQISDCVKSRIQTNHKFLEIREKYREIYLYEWDFSF